MKNKVGLDDIVFWQVDRADVVRCDQNVAVDVAIVGGGMAGLAAAQEACKQGKKVALFERFYCGSGATGKSSGFITPNAELSFLDFAKRYDTQVAHNIWDFICRGMQDIQTNITHYNFACDYMLQDTLVVASRARDVQRLQDEGDALQKIGYYTQVLDQKAVQDQIGSKRFFGGVVYKDTFGINAYRYCQALKKELQKSGVLIFEETPVLGVHNDVVDTAHAQIKAEHIIMCVDRFLPELGLLSDDVFHAQTFVLASAPLTDEQAAYIFPEQSYMVWDTELIYNYFRLTGDKRLLLGGGDLFTTYLNEKHNYKRIATKLTRYLEKTFPYLDIEFEYQWPGLIGLSKDIGPIAGLDKDNKHLYYVAAAAGLPIAAALGRYSVEHLYSGRTDLDHCFDPYRKFPIGGIVQKIVGKQLSFALCNVITQNVV